MNRRAHQPLSNEGVKLPREQCRREAPECETEVFARAVDAQVTFGRDEDGEVTVLILQHEGQEMLGRKVRS